MTFSKEQQEVMREALSTYGFDAQCDIAIEEMSELTKAIIKYRRYGTVEDYTNLCEEIADVAIMIEQLWLSTKNIEVGRFVVEKLDRLEKRLSESKAGVTNEIDSVDWHREAELNANELIKLQAENERLQRLLEQEEKSKNSLTKKCYKDGITELATVIINEILPKYTQRHNEQASKISREILEKVKEMAGADNV